MSHNEVPFDELMAAKRESRARSSVREIRCLLDDLHLQMFHLMEDQELLHLQVNKQSCRARLFLARTRLLQGSERTSAEVRLPRGRSYKALTRVIEVSKNLGKALKITRHPVEPILGYFRPLTNIFGSLVPESLRLASRHWYHCLDLVAECANTRKELQWTITSIKMLQSALD
ncbi:uncharacterized protein LOC128259688 [Drosophila gunungcola]|uniref:Vacuolar ATPase assembly protein VMA22 n=1 Tax=Drosophila gunungcola TaxID=103775 RepID=A0A9P9YJJ7_9MUSC|nr:uncharacterized protein LOC128259688 [Drosophila gunungcola]KAI8037763.1 hypothetical protein M5D96_009263 [Drosophila gunungcola]